ncbi:hypothetical protein AB1K70_03135 [Bremerella sp. JC770]|uniref:hypothetical protein n=1 Tax=Bremerella sp. JC770 TaxID=3232137 RepID=UPI0034591173
MQIVITPGGAIRCLYDESLNLNLLGKVQISRGSQVEPDETGQWFADLAPVGGPSLGPFAKRTEALAAEVAWLEEYWLPASEG